MRDISVFPCGLKPKDPRWFTPARTWRAPFPALTRNSAPRRFGVSNRSPTPRRDILSRTRRAIVPLIQSKTLSLSGVAEKLSMQPRTLNRRLAPEGASFQGEVERLRYEFSRQLLANTDLPISQVAYALGYSAISAFSRSFRRWSGTTPGEWREKL